MSKTQAVVFALGSLVAVTAWTGALPARAQAPSATMFRGDAAHLGVYASAAPTLSRVKWRFATRGKIFSSPAVLDGVVYVGSTDGNLYAVRAADGSLVWRFPTHGPVNSSPAVADGLVYFSSLDGNVYAVNTSDGRERWHFATAGERRFTAPGIHGIEPKHEMMADPFDVFLSSPAVANGVVYIGSGDHNVYAIDAATGRLRWTFSTGNVVHASPAVADGMVFIGSWDRNFYALDAATGTLRWKFQTGDDRSTYNQVGIAGSAAVAGGMVYFGCRDSFVYALDERTGHLRWKHDEHGSWVIATPAIASGTIYYAASDERTFFALDAETGAKRFSVGYGAYTFSSPSLAGGVAYFGMSDGRLYGVDASTGAIVARFQTDASRRDLATHLDKNGNLDVDGFFAEPTLGGIYAGLNDLFTGVGSIFGSPAISGGTLYIGSTEGVLYALT
jgi:outer membrane protein assembly factor BamB